MADSQFPFALLADRDAEKDPAMNYNTLSDPNTLQS
jgi:hypothetical protein